MASKAMSNTEIGLKVLAWLGLVGGALGVFGGIITLLMALFMPFKALYANMPGMPPEMGEHMERLMHFEAWMILFILPLYGLGIAGGAGILKRQGWGRGLMEAAAWYHVVLVAAGLSVLLSGAVDLGFLAPPPLPGQDPAVQAKAAQMMSMVMQVMGGAMALVTGALSGALLWFLRRQPTRDWFRRA